MVYSGCYWCVGRALVADSGLQWRSSGVPISQSWSLVLAIGAVVVWRPRISGQHWSLVAPSWCIGRATMAIIALLIHSITDFNLHIPANAATFMVVLALAWTSRFGGSGGGDIPLGRKPNRVINGQ